MNLAQFLPCPFCNALPETGKATAQDRWRLWHRCPAVGYMQIDWRENVAALAEIWNKREGTE